MASSTDPAPLLLTVDASATVPAHRVNEIGEVMMTQPVGAVLQVVSAAVDLALQQWLDAIGAPEGTVVVDVALAGGLVSSRSPEPDPES